MDWLTHTTTTDRKMHLEHFFNACKARPSVGKEIEQLLERLCDKVKAHLRNAEVPCAIDELCERAQQWYFKILLALLQSEEKRLQQNDFSGLLSNEQFHTALLACCMEGVFASYSQMAFPIIPQILELHPFNLMKVVESVVKHEPSLPAKLKEHFLQIESCVLERLAWSQDSPLHGLVVEYEASRAAAQTGQARTQLALEQFFKKCRCLAASRTQDMCRRLLL
ncbi:MAG: hypothetical protein SGPRY_005271, partial [Prymnesium sp.]